MAGRTLRREVRRPAGPSRVASWVRRARTAALPTTWLPRRVWWVALTVVAGLFAMHGLGIHGAHSEAHSHADSSSTHGWVAATDHDGGLVAAGAGHAVETHTVDGRPATGSAADSSPGPSGNAGVLGLCLTILTFGVMWLRAWARRRLGWTILRRPITACVAVLSVTARGLSPPLRAELSVWRC